VNFAFSEEQEAFRELLRRFLEQRSPVSEVFRLMETPGGHDPAVWKQMAEELGLQGLRIEERHGGQGFGFLELGLVMEEMGRVLLCAPYFSTVCLGAGAIQNVASETQQAALLPGIAAGEIVATLALLDRGAPSGWDPAQIALEFAKDGDGYRLDGAKRLVSDGAQADLIVVAARVPGSRGGDGLTLFSVRAGPGVSAEAVDPLDATRKLAHLEFDGARAELLGVEGGAGAGLARTLDEARIALAAESTGGARRCLDAAVAYAKERVQFHRPIGSFQAIKHKCADVLLEVESASAAAQWASWVAAEQAEDPEALSLAAAVAKSFCDDAYLRAAGENIHVHGGIGFTWEADPHLYYKRARANAELLGTPTTLRRRIAELKGF
jgi:alkylation response protein AidB-like acyl-CoA dehydrogenase